MAGSSRIPSLDLPHEIFNRTGVTNTIVFVRFSASIKRASSYFRRRTSLRRGRVWGDMKELGSAFRNATG